MFRILPERPEDRDEVERLLDTAFAPGRTALSSYRLRDGVAPVAPLCRIARDDYDAVAAASGSGRSASATRATPRCCWGRSPSTPRGRARAWARS